MNTTYAKADTLVGAALAPLDWTRTVGVVFAFSLLTALAAQVSIPIRPVPVTAQTFAVLLTGALLGSRLGAATMLVYLAEGAVGLPFFTGGMSSIPYLLGPTGGYLVAFPAAAYVTGAFAENGWDKNFFAAATAMFVGSLIIILLGWAWLSQFMTPIAAFHAGVEPFILGDIIKILLAAGTLPLGWQLLKRKASGKK